MSFTAEKSLYLSFFSDFDQGDTRILFYVRRRGQKYPGTLIIVLRL